MASENYRQITAASYDRFVVFYSEENTTPDFWRPEFERVTSLFNARGIFFQGERFLDLGCGPGVRDATLATDVGFRYVGVDLSSEMLKLAQGLVLQGEFVEMDVTNLSFGNDEFLAVWASGIFLHLKRDDLRFALSEMRRVMRPDGLGFIAMRKRLSGQNQEVMRTETKGGVTVSRQFSFFSEEEFTEMLHNAGFGLLEMTNNPKSDEKQWMGFIVDKVGS